MNWVDFAVVAIVIVLVALVVYFHFVRPRLHKATRKSRRLVKDFNEAKQQESAGKAKVGECDDGKSDENERK